MRLLVVEDNERLAAVMLRLLGEHGFVADRVATVDTALAALDLAPYDLVLLDLSLPDGDGGAVLRAIRQRCRDAAGAGRQGTPVLVATARGEVVERVRMLDLGADDYLVKPFSFDELLARVRALLRRPRQIADPVLAAGNVRLDTASLTLSVAGERVDAPRRELGVLAALLASQGRLLRK
jgi:DNA-binding response OmpR family regulator